MKAETSNAQHPTSNAQEAREEAVRAALPKGKRVHRLRDGAPRCGGGRHGKHGLWQLDLGEVTCRRCRKLAEWDRSREAREGGEGKGHEEAQEATETEKSEVRNPKCEGNPKLEKRRRNP